MAGQSRNPQLAKRRYARIRAMQALYQQDLAGGDIGDILTQFHETQELDKVDIAYFEALFRGAAMQLGHALQLSLSQGIGVPPRGHGNDR